MIASSTDMVLLPPTFRGYAPPSSPTCEKSVMATSLWKLRAIIGICVRLVSAWILSNYDEPVAPLVRLDASVYEPKTGLCCCRSHKPSPSA